MSRCRLRRTGCSFFLGGAELCAMRGSTVDTVHSSVEALRFISHFSTWKWTPDRSCYLDIIPWCSAVSFLPEVIKKIGLQWEMTSGFILIFSVARQWIHAHASVYGIYFLVASVGVIVVVSAVMSQGHHGSCWTFSATQAVDSQLVLTSGGYSVVLSALQVTSCTLSTGGCCGCDGCWTEGAFV